jgi:hypothetical protein
MSTYTPISSQTLSANTTTVTFSGIPQTYTDLVIVANYNNTTSVDMFIRFNGITTNVYSDTQLYGNGSSAASYRQSNAGAGLLDLGALGFGTGLGTTIIQIMNYSNTTTNKTYLTRSSFSALTVGATVGLWRSTAAINEVSILSSSANAIASGSTFTLYGIGAGSPKAFGGDEVTTDGTYWYHTYRSSGIFSPMQNISCDYLVVAGGGGGGAIFAGSSGGGGGGAGGLRCTVGATGGGSPVESPLSLTAGNNYTVTIGAGGVGVSPTVYGGLGSNSVFGSITSVGGGGGGSGVGRPGGSGGGGGASNTPISGGSGTANQGYAGATAGTTSGSPYSSGGGGGASQTPSWSNTSGGGPGGNGVTTSISGTSTTYAGGGGGSQYNGATVANAGGSGGGGAGGTPSGAVAGTANTGGGGGGASNGNTSAAGGSGIVIVRYAV